MLDALSAAPDGVRDAALAHFVGQHRPRRRPLEAAAIEAARDSDRHAAVTALLLGALGLTLSLVVPGILAARPLAGPGPGRRGRCSGRRSPWPRVLCALGVVLAAPEELVRAAGLAAPAGRRGALVGALAVAAVIVHPAAGLAGRGQLPLAGPPGPPPDAGRPARPGRAARRAAGEVPAGLRVLDGPLPFAYCLPGREPRVVLSGGALRVLDRGAGRRGARPRAGPPAAPARPGDGVVHRVLPGGAAAVAQPGAAGRRTPAAGDGGRRRRPAPDAARRRCAAALAVLADAVRPRTTPAEAGG